MFSNNGCRRPCWPKITFNRISRHFRSMRNFNFFINLFTKWLLVLDDRKSPSITFIFYKMVAGGHFGWPKITFYCISCHFRSIQNLYFFHKMVAGGHFGWPKITLDRISRHFISIRNFDFFSTKWLPVAILDDRKSLLIAYLAISYQYATFFYKMAAGGHFGWPKITFDRISRHFRSIRNFDFFFSQNVCRRPFWMTENHFRSHFSPFQISTQLWFFFFTKWLPVAILDDRKSLSITFLAISDKYTTILFHKNDRKSLSIAFLAISDQYATFSFLGVFLFKMAAGGHFGSPIWAKTIGFFHYVLSMAMPNMKLIG